MTIPRIAMLRSLALAGYLVLAAVPAHAQLDQVYAWEVPGRGWLEPTVWTQFIPSSDLEYDRFSGASSRENLLLQTFELEYGIGEDAAVGVYVDFERADGEPFRYAQVRLVARKALFTRYERFFDTALYAEYYQPRVSYGEPAELELRLILEKQLGDLQLLLNPMVSRAMSGDEVDEGFEGGFAGGVYYRRFFAVQPGVEYYSASGRLADPDPLSDQRHVLYPAVDINLIPGLTLNLGAGFGLTDGSDDLTVKSILSYEFGTIRPANQRR